jgi:hypothetical protein
MELATRIWSDVTDLIGSTPTPEEICEVIRILTDVADDTRLTSAEEETVKERVRRLTTSHDVLLRAKSEFEQRLKDDEDDV